MDVKSTNDALRYLYKLSPSRTNLRFRGQADFDWTVQPSIYRYTDIAGSGDIKLCSLKAFYSNICRPSQNHP